MARRGAGSRRCAPAGRRLARWRIGRALLSCSVVAGALASTLASTLVSTLAGAAPAQGLAASPANPGDFATPAPVGADAAAVARGAAIVASRSQGLCVLCHALPGQPAAQQGTLGPPLAGVGSRYPLAELRERLTAPERFNSDTVMPSYARREGLARVAPTHLGQPLLAPTQIDDVVAWLAAQR